MRGRHRAAVTARRAAAITSCAIAIGVALTGLGHAETEPTKPGSCATALTALGTAQGTANTANAALDAAKGTHNEAKAATVAAKKAYDDAKAASDAAPDDKGLKEKADAAFIEYLSKLSDETDARDALVTAQAVADKAKGAVTAAEADVNLLCKGEDGTPGQLGDMITIPGTAPVPGIVESDLPVTH